MMTTVLSSVALTLLALRWSVVMRGRVAAMARDVRETQDDELAAWAGRGGRIGGAS